MPTVVFRGTRDELMAMLSQIPAALAGGVADPAIAATVQTGIQLRLGMALLSQVQQSFVIKSRHGVGEDGIQWPKLSPRTIAAKGGDQILVDTGLMLKSLSPAVTGGATAPILFNGEAVPFQVLNLTPGEVTVGTNRYPHHHTGIAPWLPQRALWPTDGSLPAKWWNAIRGAATRGLIDVIVYLAGRR